MDVDVRPGSVSGLPGAERTFAGEAAVRAMLPRSQRRFRGIVLRRLCGDNHAADDVLQEFALKALHNANSLRDPLAVEAWLGRVLHSTLADHWRRAAKQREQSQDPHVLAELASTEAEQDKPHECCCLEQAFAALKPAQADLIQRMDLEGEACEAAARRLGIATNALHVRAHRARRALRTALAACCKGCGSHRDESALSNADQSHPTAA